MKDSFWARHKPARRTKCNRDRAIIELLTLILQEQRKLASLIQLAAR